MFVVLINIMNKNLQVNKRNMEQGHVKRRIRNNQQKMSKFLNKTEMIRN